MKAVFIVLLALKLIVAKPTSIKQSLLDAAKELQEAQAEEEGRVYHKYKAPEHKVDRRKLEKSPAPIEHLPHHQKTLIEDIQQFVKQEAQPPHPKEVRRGYYGEFSTPVETEQRTAHDYRWKPKNLKRKQSAHEPKSKNVFPVDKEKEFNNNISKLKMSPYFRNEILGKEREVAARNEILGKEREVAARNEILGKEREVAARNEILGKEREVAARNEILGKEREVAAQLARRAFRNSLIPAYQDEEDELDKDELEDLYDEPREAIYSEFPDDSEIQNEERTYDYNDLNYY